MHKKLSKPDIELLGAVHFNWLLTTLPATILVLLCLTSFGRTQEIDLTRLSIEELMNLEVQLVSKKNEFLFETSAASYVISAEDLQNSGLTSLPDLLRLAPGFVVARIDANKWAISSRGFNGVFANKLLVLVDGRSVYSPLFSGVFWNYQDIFLEDIAQIEIVRGPGATLWGSNAVNGIVNVLTKPARETQDGLLSVAAGTEEQLLTAFRYGGKVGKNLFYRFDAKYSKHNHLVDSTGAATKDGWFGQRSAFRVDWEPNRGSQITLQGDYYTDEVGQMARIIPAENQPYFKQIDSVATDNGGNVLLRLAHQFSTANKMTWQLYYDKFMRHDIIMNGVIETFDYDFNHRFQFTPAHEIIWGMGYRHIRGESEGTFYFSLASDRYSMGIFNAFFQDELLFLRAKLHLTLGSKFEYQDFTGLEVQPNIRLLFHPNPGSAYWLAASRAVRIPSVVERDAISVRGITNVRGIPVFGILLGSHDYKSEILHAYELGMRKKLSTRLNFDLALFFNQYNSLRNYEQGDWEYKFSPAPAHGMAYFYMDNNMSGYSFGGELLVKFKPASWCQFETSYSKIKIKVDLENTNLFYDLAKGTEGETPEHQAMLWGAISLPFSLYIDFNFRFIDKIPTLKIGHYFNLDTQLSWQVNHNLKLFIVGQNLLEKRHAEYSPAYGDILAGQVPRGFFGKLQVTF